MKRIEQHTSDESNYKRRRLLLACANVAAGIIGVVVYTAFERLLLFLLGSFFFLLFGVVDLVSMARMKSSHS
jgi:hypothetical protein